MWCRFKWNMFITSFIPLWLSIIIADIWDIICNCLKSWDNNVNMRCNIFNCMKSNLLLVISILVITIVVIFSILGINSFIKRVNSDNNIMRGKIIKARKANKLSSEFLLAYILPMIAFDFDKLKSVIMFIIYFSVLAFLCLRNNNIYTNILLEFKGYKIYNCDIECNVMNSTKVYEDSFIISQYDLTVNESNSVKYWDFVNYIYITAKED